MAVIGVSVYLFSGMDKKMCVRYQGAKTSKVCSCLCLLLTRGINERVSQQRGSVNPELKSDPKNEDTKPKGHHEQEGIWESSGLRNR